MLDEDHYGLPDVKDRVLEFLAVRQLRAQEMANEVETTGEVPVGELKDARDDATPVARRRPTSDRPVTDKKEAKARAMAKGPILLFFGPPGVGKTSIAKSIARSLGRVRGWRREREADIAARRARRRARRGGHPRPSPHLRRRHARPHHPGAQAGEDAESRLPARRGRQARRSRSRAIRRARCSRCSIPAQNDTFTDHYLGVPFDLSEVLFIATANFIQNIPGPLLDRMEVVEFAGYTEREKAEIAKKYLIPRQLEESGLKSKNVVLHRRRRDEHRVEVHARERRAAARAAGRRGGAEGRAQARVGRARTISRSSPEDVRELLGRPRVHPERANEENEVGVAAGMYYTPMGGDIMFVEAAIRRLHGAQRATDSPDEKVQVSGWGNVSLILTGQLGDVMKESARAALTYAATHASALKIPEDRLGSIEVHVHVPAGAIPKDGPSAGVAISTALVSAMSGRPVRRDVAMTGEITLRGRVLPIGGLKEKVLGAHRAGITTIILPKDNEADMEDIPEEVRNQLTFHCVSTLDEAFAIALVPAVERHSAPAQPTIMERRRRRRRSGAGRPDRSSGAIAPARMHYVLPATHPVLLLGVRVPTDRGLHIAGPFFLPRVAAAAAQCRDGRASPRVRAPFTPTM